VNVNKGFIEAADAELYFERAGGGPAVLFFHAGVADLRMWDGQVEALGSNYNCIRFDMRGFGQTRNRAESYSPTADVLAILDHLEVGAAHLVGLSMGGGLALEVVIDEPRRANSVTVVAAGVRGMKEERPPTETELAEMTEIEKAEEAKDWDRAVDLQVQYWLDGPGRAGRIQGEVREKMRLMCRDGYGRDEPLAKPVFTQTPAIERLEEINVPALIVVGTGDESIIMDIGNQMAELIPGSKKLVYEGAAHMINLEEPDRFNSDLIAFLQGGSEDGR
jgi:3-oxoadipate enol-lactonase